MLALTSVVGLMLTHAGGAILLILFAPLCTTITGCFISRARVQLNDGGLVVNDGRLFPQRVTWGEVKALRIDPPGRPRTLRLDLHDGRQVGLPPLGDDDRALVEQAFEASRPTS